MSKAPRTYHFYGIHEWNADRSALVHSTVLSIFRTGTIDINAGPVVVEISRDAAAKALRDARRNGYQISRYVGK